MFQIVTVSAAENAQFIPKKIKNGHIYSQTNNAIYIRKNLESHPEARKRRNAHQRESSKKKREIERALLAAGHSDGRLGKFA